MLAKTGYYKKIGARAKINAIKSAKLKKLSAKWNNSNGK